MDTKHIVVVGGGIIGLSIAWQLGRADQRVTVIDPHPGSGASFAAAGMLAIAGEVGYGEIDVLPLAQESAQRYPSFVADLLQDSAVDVGYQQCGSYLVGFDADDMAAIDDVAGLYATLGLGVTRLTGSALRQSVSLLSPRVRGGIHLPDDHQINPRRLHEALSSAAQLRGVVAIRERVQALLMNGDTVRGVVTDQRQIEADTVVLAAGAHSSTIGHVPADECPVRPIKGQTLRVRPFKPQEPVVDSVTIRAIVRGRHLYLVPGYDGTITLGATSDERGFETQSTVLAVHDLTHDAIEVVPAIAEYEFCESNVGWRPGTPDNGPVVGASRLPGLVHATGHFRNGVLLTPVTAHLMTNLILHGEIPDLGKAYSPQRFTSAESRTTQHDDHH